jgi:hypothetical protein
MKNFNPQTQSAIKKKKRRWKVKGRQVEQLVLDEITELFKGITICRDELIEYLHKLQDNFGVLYDKHLVALSIIINLPLSEIYEVATFYAHFNIVKDSTGSKSSKWMNYNTKDDRFTLSFGRRTVLGNFFGTEDDNSEHPYDLIVKDIKEKCKYYKIINYKGTDYVTYSCSDSSYKGKIGFVIEEGRGIIRHFPTTE